MKCNHCGHELRENETTCHFCGSPISDSTKIKVTYENSETELVSPPVIMEAHTFIDEESFAKKINKENQNTPLSQNSLDEMWDEPSNKHHFAWLFVIIIIIILGLVGYFVVYPNIKVDSKNITKDKSDFSSDQWTSGEFKIDGDYYQLKKSYTKFYDNNWLFVDDEILDLILDPEEETEEYILSRKSNQEQIKVKIKNPKTKENSIKDSIVWSVEVDTSSEDNILEFILPGNIKNGSSLEEIKSRYGELKEDNIIRDEKKKITTYQYAGEEKINLDLIIDDTEGLKAFHYYYS